MNPHDILRIKGETALQNYLVQEVQKVYRSQGVDINDKHIEVIVRSMLRKKKVTEPRRHDACCPGRCSMTRSSSTSTSKVAADGQEAGASGHGAARRDQGVAGDRVVLVGGVFQETTRVLTQAAIEGKYDPLLGLKENVIIGKLIPAGTGMPKYRGVEVWGKGQPRYREVDIFGEPELPAEIDGEAEPENKYALVAELVNEAPLAIVPPEPAANGDVPVSGDGATIGEGALDGDGALAVEAPPEAPPETPPVTELDM